MHCGSTRIACCHRRSGFFGLIRSADRLDLVLHEVSRNVALADAGWSSSVARRAHNPEVAGSNPAPATRERSSDQANARLEGLSLCPGFRQGTHKSTHSVRRNGRCPLPSRPGRSVRRPTAGVGCSSTRLKEVARDEARQVAPGSQPSSPTRRWRLRGACVVKDHDEKHKNMIESVLPSTAASWRRSIGVDCTGRPAPGSASS